MTDDQKTPDENDIAKPVQKGGGEKDAVATELAVHPAKNHQPANPEDPDEAQSPT